MFLIILLIASFQGEAENPNLNGPKVKSPNKIKKIYNDTCIFPNNKQNEKELCLFTVENCKQEDSIGKISYLKTRYCSLQNHPLVFFILIGLLCISLITILVLVADLYLVPSLLYFSNLIGLSDELSGVLILSIGNAAPDVFSQISTSGNLKLSISESIGSSLFAVCIIIGTILILRPTIYSTNKQKQINQKLTLDSKSFIQKDIPTLFFIFIVYSFLLITRLISTIFAIILLCSYVAYIVLSLWFERKILLKDKYSHNQQTFDNNGIEQLNLKIIIQQEQQQSNNISLPENTSSLENQIPHSMLGFFYSEFISIIYQLYRTVCSEINNQQNDNNLQIESNQLISQQQLSQDNQTIAQNAQQSKITYIINKFLFWFKFPFILIICSLIPSIDKKQQSSFVRIFFNCILSPILISLSFNWNESNQQQSEHQESVRSIPIWFIAIFIGLLLLPLVQYLNKLRSQQQTDQSQTQKIPQIIAHIFFYGWAFIMSLFIIKLVASELAAEVVASAILFHVSSSFISSTLLVWCSAIGDYITDILFAIKGYSLISVSASIAAPIFQSLVGLSLSIISSTFLQDKDITSSFISIDKSDFKMFGTLLFGFFSAITILQITCIILGKSHEEKSNNNCQINGDKAAIIDYKVDGSVANGGIQTNSVKISRQKQFIVRFIGACLIAIYVVVLLIIISFQL